MVGGGGSLTGPAASRLKANILNALKIYVRGFPIFKNSVRLEIYIKKKKRQLQAPPHPPPLTF